MFINKKSLNDLRDELIAKGFYIVPYERYDEVVRLCSQYYESDPIFSWLCGGLYSEEIVEDIMRGIVYGTYGSSLCYADSEDINTVCVWFPPGFDGLKLFPFMKITGEKLIKEKGIGFIVKLLNYETTAMTVKKHHTNHNDWYLCNFAKNDKNPNQAENMIKPVVEYCWKNEYACYVEAYLDSKIAVFKKIGFQVKESVAIKKGNVIHYGMMI